MCLKAGQLARAAVATTAEQRRRAPFTRLFIQGRPNSQLTGLQIQFGAQNIS